jgi:hypothetical protein
MSDEQTQTAPGAPGNDGTGIQNGGPEKPVPAADPVQLQPNSSDLAAGMVAARDAQVAAEALVDEKANGVRGKRSGFSIEEAVESMKGLILDFEGEQHGKIIAGLRRIFGG